MLKTFKTKYPVGIDQLYDDTLIFIGINYITYIYDTSKRRKGFINAIKRFIYGFIDGI